MTNKRYITIGELSKLSGFPADTIRYYEKLGILKKPDRAGNGYRVYTSDTLNILLFIRRGKVMNFTLDEIKQVLNMTEDETAVCGDVLPMVEEKIIKFKQQIEDTKIALKSLEHFAKNCPGGQVPAEHCPFVHYLNNKAGGCHEEKQ